MFQHAVNDTERPATVMPPVWAAMAAAVAIARVAEHPRREVYTDNAGRTLNLLERFAPGVARRLAAKNRDPASA